MALGKSARLYVKNGLYTFVGPPGGSDPPAGANEESGDAVAADIIANWGTPTTGDLVAGDADDWFEVCAVDVDVSQTRQFIDAADRCSGSFGAGTPGSPEWSLTWNAWKKVSTAFTKWQSLLQTKYDASEGSAGEFTALMVDQSPTEISAVTGDTDEAVSDARGVILICKCFTLSESQPLNGNIEVSYEIRPSGDAAQSPPARRVNMSSTRP